jgi:Protein of unknown function (DUF3179)
MKNIYRIRLLIVLVTIIAASIFISAQLGFFETSATDSDGIMLTNGVRHSVPLQDIIFDDFDSASRSLPLSNATQADIERLRDRIRPICRGEIAACLPLNYEDVATADAWMSDIMFVMTYIATDGQAYAYPFNILNYHEMVSDTIADEAVLITYCPLCNSAIIYSRILDGQELFFGNTNALYNSDMVMYDTATDSFWFQVAGRAIVGELTGAELTMLPSAITTWGEWKIQHPDSLVLARPNTGINYGRNVFAAYDRRVNRGEFFFPVDEAISADSRLQAAANVLLVEIGDQAIAYPLKELGNAATQDTIAGQDIVLLSLDDGASGAAYQPITDAGTSVELEYSDGAWSDSNTDSNFNLSGQAISGTLQGEYLIPITARYTFWFAALASAPHVTVYAP